MMRRPPTKQEEAMRGCRASLFLMFPLYHLCTNFAARAEPLSKDQIGLIEGSAANICNTVSEARGHISDSTIEGGVGAKIGGLAGRLASVSGNAGGRLSQRDFEGLTQQATAEAMSGDRGCRERVFDKMFDTFSRYNAGAPNKQIADAATRTSKSITVAKGPPAIGGLRFGQSCISATASAPGFTQYGSAYSRDLTLIGYQGSLSFKCGGGKVVEASFSTTARFEVGRFSFPKLEDSDVPTCSAKFSRFIDYLREHYGMSGKLPGAPWAIERLHSVQYTLNYDYYKDVAAELGVSMNIRFNDMSLTAGRCLVSLGFDDGK